MNDEIIYDFKHYLDDLYNNLITYGAHPSAFLLVALIKIKLQTLIDESDEFFTLATNERGVEQ